VAYTFDNLFAADPSNPANVAANASILLYDPADPTKTPVTLSDPTGSPIPNPVTVNKNGFGPAMQHATLDRLAWEGGGFSNFITSYEGIKNEAVSARTAAQEAAATAGADAAAVADAAIGTATDEATAAAAAAAAAADAADASALAAANSAALVGAPADNAIATAINASGSATKTALSATYSPLGIKGAAVPPSGADDTAAIQAALTAGKTVIQLEANRTYSAGALTLTAPTVFVGSSSTLNLSAPMVGAFSTGFNGVKVVANEAVDTTSGGSVVQAIRGGLEVRNERSSAAPALDVAGFQSQGGAANNARTVQVHHYNDNDAMWIDNVGAGAALRLNNARNITRRADKDSAYVGTGVYVTMREMKTDGSSYMELFNINNKAEFTWTGAAGSRVSTAKFTQNKADDGQWAFSFPTTNSHANVVTFGQAAEIITDVSGTRSVIRSHSSRTVGLMVTTAAGALTLGSADGNIYTTGAQFTTSGDTTPVKFNRSINVRNYGTLASNLPTLGAGDRALASAESKLYFWTGTAWQQVTSA